MRETNPVILAFRDPQDAVPHPEKDILDPCNPESCDGERHICPDCEGEGNVFVESEDPNDFGEGSWRNCTTCKGDGGWDCPRAGKEAK